MLYDDIAAIIASVATPDTGLSFGGLPEDPLNCVAIYQYGGAEPIWTAGSTTATGPAMERPRFQIVVRDTDQVQAWSKATAIYNLLRWYSGTVNGVVYHLIAPLGDHEELLDEMSREGRRTLTFRVATSYEAHRSP